MSCPFWMRNFKKKNMRLIGGYFSQLHIQRYRMKFWAHRSYLRKDWRLKSKHKLCESKSDPIHEYHQFNRLDSRQYLTCLNILLTPFQRKSHVTNNLMSCLQFDWVPGASKVISLLTSARTNIGKFPEWNSYWTNYYLLMSDE